MAMDKFTMSLNVKFLPDKASMNEIKHTLDTFKILGVDDKGITALRSIMNKLAASDATAKRIADAMQDYRTATGFDEDDNIKSLRNMLAEAVSDNPKLKDAYAELLMSAEEKVAKEKEEEEAALLKEEDDKRNAFIKTIKQQVLNKAEDLAKSFLQGIANAFKDAWSELKNIMQSSFMTNSQTRENMFAYGMTAADSYGFEQAKSMLGINSEEDLWYMNQTQREQFRRVMTKYADKYNELADSGFFNTMLEYQIEMEEFKKDMQLSIVEFIMDNKDTIKEFMTATMQFLKVIMEGVSWLVDNFTDRRTTDEEKAANIDSILNSYTQNNKSMTLNQTNTFNSISGQYVDSSLNQLTAQTTEALRAFGE